jgi:hypothetical protein
MKIEASEVERTAQPMIQNSMPAVPPPPPHRAIDATFRQVLPSDTKGGANLALIADPAGLAPKKQIDYYKVDPNLALVNMRIEIERRLARLAQIYDVRYPAPLSRVVRDLAQRDVLDLRFTEPLMQMIRYGNEAAHGADVELDVANVANKIEPIILAELDFLVRKAQESLNQ